MALVGVGGALIVSAGAFVLWPAEKPPPVKPPEMVTTTVKTNPDQPPLVLQTQTGSGAPQVIVVQQPQQVLPPPEDDAEDMAPSRTTKKKSSKIAKQTFASKLEDDKAEPPPLEKPVEKKDEPKFVSEFGSVKLKVLNGWADIKVDGVPQGRAPMVKSITLPEGVHVIELHNPLRQPYRAQVNVEAGKPTEHVATLKEL